MKSKVLVIKAFCLLLSSSVMAQWEATNHSSSTNNVILDFCEHNANLYTASYEGLKKWDASAEQWDSIPFTGFQIYPQEYIQQLVSAGNFLYATKWNPYCASNLVYKSSDDGLSFVLDTMGLPRAPVCDSLPSAILAMFSLPNGKVVIEFGANFYAKFPNDALWVIDNSHARYMAFGASAWYRMSTSALFKSTDEGQNWTTSAATSFPPGLQPSVLEVNSETGRIYMNAKYGFENISLYSDNEGTTWDTLPVNTILGNSWIGFSQIVQSLYAKGDYISFGAEQNANSTHSDVFVSFDGGQTFSTDTVGLRPNAGIEVPTDLHAYNDEIFLVFNSFEVYRKGAVLGVSELEEKSSVKLYPNPTNNLLYIQSEKEIERLILYDLQGNVVSNAEVNLSKSFIDMHSLESGIYLLKVMTGGHEEIQRIVKQ